LIHQLGFGGASLTSMSAYASAKKLLNHAFDAGIRHFDTAPLYGKGYSEWIYGQFLKDKRERVTVTTKFGLGQFPTKNLLPIHVLMPLNYWAKQIKNNFNKKAVSPAVYTPLTYRKIDKNTVKTSLDDSLKRLKTDYLDYYLLHEALPHFLTDEALSFLLKMKKIGRVRFIGIGSNIADIKTLNPQDISHWDVLQYEGHDAVETAEMRKKFPNHAHFHHSCVKNTLNLKENGANSVGRRLADCAAKNANGKIIFSTRHEAYLSNNINSFLNA
jgi:aryl-alcohol dehydrogenase-like predicted oxidoreductase